jgi:hypothetical protein
MPLVDRRVQLPIACTLDGGAAKQRVGRWVAILDSHRIDRQLTGDSLSMRFRRDAEAEKELTELVVAERECCGFVGWQLDVETDELVLRITGDPAELAALNFAD